MKELSVQEKAQRYDEVIKKLHEIITIITDNKSISIEEYIEKVYQCIKRLLKKEGKKALYILGEDGEYHRVPSRKSTGRLKEMLKEIKEEKEAKSRAVSPTDNVEPKFHEGEWLTENHPNNYARFVQILEIVNVQSNNRYRISRDLHNDKDIVERRFVEDNWHPFNIQDVKDGDVIVSGQMIILFKRFEEDADCNFIIAYAGLDISGKVQVTNKHWLISCKSKPATKEQRELLFQKMKKAGYEWDAEKKELKKIEQNITWSEEDENHIIGITQTIGGAIKYNVISYKTGNMQITWLKSLKDRYTWKPNDKQMKALDIAIRCGITLGTWVEEALKDLIEQLKKLREEQL